MHNPKEVHLQAAYRVLHYLKMSYGKQILYEKTNRLFLETYTNADYVGLVVGKRFTTDYYTSIKGNLITSRNEKQNVVIISSVDSEFQTIVKWYVSYYR